MRDFNAKCCSEPCAIPLEYSCMWSEVIQGYCKLYERYDQVVTKRKKIWKLAQPKHKKLKYHQECKCLRNTKCQIEIIDKTDRAKSTRTEQLAFPKLRQLTHLKSHSSFSSFHNNRKSGVNRLIRKGLLSVYSRLQNVTPEEKPPQTKVWSVESKTRLMKRLKSLALPKKPPIEKRKMNKSKNVEGPKMKRIRKLSKPRVHKEVEPNEWVLTNALKEYKATERLIRMSQPKKVEDVFLDEDPFRNRQNGLNYKASRRIKALAEPTKNRGSNVETSTDNPFQTNIRALKAVASKRVTELATPKAVSDMHTRADAFQVSRKALRAKATTRLKELSEPKRR